MKALATTAQRCHAILHKKSNFSSFVLILGLIGEKGHIKDIYSRGQRNQIQVLSDYLHQDFSAMGNRAPNIVHDNKIHSLYTEQLIVLDHFL